MPSSSQKTTPLINSYAPANITPDEALHLSGISLDSLWHLSGISLVSVWHLFDR